jgi:sugar phosphate isomerase/epimerase
VYEWPALVEKDMKMPALDRRSLLSAFAAAGATAMMEGPAAAARSRLFFGTGGRQVGLQLYTLGDEPAQDLAGVFTRLAATGFRDLQLPSMFGKTPAELKRAADAAGMQFSCIHLGVPPITAPGALALTSDIARIVEDLGVLGIKDVVLPLMPLPEGFRPAAGLDFRAAIVKSLSDAGPDHWKKTADLLNERAAKLKPHGIRLGYHNHNVEFARYGKKTAWDILAAETDKAHVYFEVDIGWVAAAGLDPVAFLNRYKGRVRWLHVKDLKASTKPNIALMMDPTEVGSGKQDWARILPAAAKAGCEHFYIEQEAPFEIPRMDAAAKGYAYLKGLKA